MASLQRRGAAIAKKRIDRQPAGIPNEDVTLNCLTDAQRHGR